MADHGTVEYATATGNDYAAHEGTYEKFVQFAFVGTINVVNLMIGLATGGVLGHWLAALLIFIVAIVGAIPGMVSTSKTSSYVAFVISFAIFAFYGLSH